MSYFLGREDTGLQALKLKGFILAKDSVYDIVREAAGMKIGRKTQDNDKKEL